MQKGKVLLSVSGFNPQRWHELLAAGREVVLGPETANDPSITYAVVWKQPPSILAGLPNLKAVFSIGAGVDHILADRRCPTCLSSASSTESGPAHDRICGLARARPSSLRPDVPRAAEAQDLARASAADRRRHLGRHHGVRQSRPDRGRALLSLGFRVNGWSRGPHEAEGVTHVRRRSGPADVPQCHRHSGRAAAAHRVPRRASSTMAC